MATRVPWTPIVAGGGLFLGIVAGALLGPMGWFGPGEAERREPAPPIPHTDPPAPEVRAEPDPELAPLARLPPPPPLDGPLWDELALALRPHLDGVPVVCLGGPALPPDETLADRAGDLLPPMYGPEGARFLVTERPTRIPLPRNAHRPEVVLDIDVGGRCTVTRVATGTVSGAVTLAEGMAPVDRIQVCGSPVRVFEDGTFAGDVTLDAVSASKPGTPCDVRVEGGVVTPSEIPPDAVDLALAIGPGTPERARGPVWRRSAEPSLETVQIRLKAAARTVLSPELSPEARAWLRHRVSRLAATAEVEDPLAELRDLTSSPDVSIDELLDAIDAGKPVHEDTDG